MLLLIVAFPDDHVGDTTTANATAHGIQHQIQKINIKLYVENGIVTVEMDSKRVDEEQLITEL